MFGISFSELLLVLIVALVVVGPQKLPRMLGTLGTWIGKLRQLSTDMRRQTGIDEILREEGFTGGIAELRGIMRGDVMRGDVGAIGRYPAARNTADPYAAAVEYDRSREYPTEGPDAYGAIPEDLLEAPEQSDGAEPTAAPAPPDNGATPAQPAGPEKTGVVGTPEVAPARDGSKVTA